MWSGRRKITAKVCFAVRQYPAGDHAGGGPEADFLHARPSVPQEADLVRLKREAKAKGGFYVEPEAKVMFVVRIRGINDMAPKVRVY